MQTTLTHKPLTTLGNTTFNGRTRMDWDNVVKTINQMITEDGENEYSASKKFLQKYRPMSSYGNELTSAGSLSSSISKHRRRLMLQAAGIKSRRRRRSTSTSDRVLRQTLNKRHSRAGIRAVDQIKLIISLPLDNETKLKAIIAVAERA